MCILHVQENCRGRLQLLEMIEVNAIEGTDVSAHRYFKASVEQWNFQWDFFIVPLLSSAALYLSEESTSQHCQRLVRLFLNILFILV